MTAYLRMYGKDLSMNVWHGITRSVFAVSFKTFWKDLKTYHIGLAWETLITNASGVCPESVLPLLSTIVPVTCKNMYRKKTSL